MRDFILYFRFILILSLLCLTACNNDNTKTVLFTKADYEGQWPFSVNSVEVYCAGYREIYGKTEKGQIYPLNGSAKSASKDNPEIGKIEEIWLDNPNFQGTKIPYSAFIQEGLKLCEK